MEDLIKALILIKNYLEEYNLEYPTSCEHDTFYICGVKMDEVPLEVIHLMAQLSFIPGNDDDADYTCKYNEAGEYDGDVDFENISQEDWDNIKDNITNCFRSYRYGSC